MLLELEDDELELVDEVECVELEEVLDVELVDEVECVELEEVLDVELVDVELVDEVECVELSEEPDVLECSELSDEELLDEPEGLELELDSFELLAFEAPIELEVLVFEPLDRDIPGPKRSPWRSRSWSRSSSRTESLRCRKNFPVDDPQATSAIAAPDSNSRVRAPMIRAPFPSAWTRNDRCHRQARTARRHVTDVDVSAMEPEVENLPSTRSDCDAGR